ncbi:MAG: hypothetical protein CMN30_13170 [Sandaracinus sp.]|nr:hypothetical protein [Sandaracinus sp.]
MLSCPSCSGTIPESEIRAARQVARCPACDATVRLGRDGDHWIAQSVVEAAPPEGLRIHADEPPSRNEAGYREAVRTGGTFHASRRWWTPVVIFLTFFTLFWDGFLVLWYGIALSGGASGGTAIMLCFPLIHVAVGVGLTWFVVASWFNRTDVRVADGRLTCTHGPIPVPFDKAKPVALDDVDLFEVEATRVRQRSGRNAQSRWTVMARMRDGRKVPVVTRIGAEEHARFLQRRLERQLA